MSDKSSTKPPAAAAPAAPNSVRMIRSNMVASDKPTLEELLRAETVGYVKHDDFIATRERIEREQEEARLEEERKKERAKVEAQAKKKIAKSKLSFALDDEEGADGDNGDDEEDGNGGEKEEALSPPAAKKLKVMKNPNVDTSFLPDREKQLKEQEARDALQKEWAASQEKIKQEELEVTYSFYDGRSHRRSMKVKKGNTIAEFLAMALDDLAKDFPKLYTSSGGLMYIKEDIIMPSHMSFYDFIIAKARGKSGPLYEFDTFDDIRMEVDTSKETTSSHTGKVVTRQWYENKKNTFPVCRWEPYDPDKKWEKYTIKS